MRPHPQKAKSHLGKDGILGVWSYAENSPFADALRDVFREVRIEPITVFDNVINEEQTGWLFSVLTNLIDSLGSGEISERPMINVCIFGAEPFTHFSRFVRPKKSEWRQAFLDRRPSRSHLNQPGRKTAATRARPWEECRSGGAISRDS